MVVGAILESVASVTAYHAGKSTIGNSEDHLVAICQQRFDPKLNGPGRRGAIEQRQDAFDGIGKELRHTLDKIGHGDSRRREFSEEHSAYPN